MGTKMKGLLKGLRYISQIFDEEKEADIQIGFPTDVKHVAHIGWDGPSVESAPSWMKEFPATAQNQSAPLNINGEPAEGPEPKWVSEDSKTRKSSKPKNDVPKSSRRQSSSDGSNLTMDSPGREPTTKTRPSRRSKDSSEGSKTGKKTGDSEPGADSSSVTSALPDIPKKSRRKKSKDSGSGGGSSRSSKRASDPGAEFANGVPLGEKESGHIGVS